MRKTLSKPEYHLWQHLRRRPSGLAFRNQHPIGPYVVDFCCLSERLAIEVDGIVHDRGSLPQRDLERDRFIKENGFRVLRISAQRVLADVEGVVAAIVARAETPLHRPADGPPPRAGEDT
ncbi:very-short-patch-repair endonuclease [Novosphingobium chloroacetimidivorans]|uniref:Very-short-patch-repair endonuclease n=1 Tax=Novosphingobium chloroacetimidivorans TaxID=1428314 RepID=A0A7W7NWR6_9SPHN|nr:very-short-patch-repair endonuclease [Novosphingobium chloroacetimidivorans]